jgi:hypothetical protein
MGLLRSFKRANEVIEQSKRDIAKGRKAKDELAAKRDQKNGGRSK